MKNGFFHLPDISSCEFFILASGNEFLSNGRVFVLFRALLKLLKFEGGNSCLWKLLSLASRTFPLHFSDTPSSESCFPSSENVFLNESSNPYDGGVISVLWKPFSPTYDFSRSGIHL